MTTNHLIITVFIIIDLALMVWAILKYFIPLSVTSAKIDEALESLQSYQQDDYTLRFEDINKTLSQNQTIQGVWQDFSKTLTRVHNYGGKDELYSPVEAGEFFRYNAFVKNVNVTFWQNFGSIFTGVGILGTFLGLVLGLHGVDLSSSNVAVLKEGIGNLLGGISLAFVTSLLGIICALIYGIGNKHYQDALSKKVSRLAGRIEDMYPRRTVEQWLSEGQRESAEQTKAIKNLSSEMAESLSELLDQQLSTGFEELCQKLDEQMKPTFEKLYEAISSLNDGGATAIAGAVSEKAGAQLDAFAGALEQMQQTMKESLEVSERTSAQANAMMAETMQKIGSSLAQGTDEAVRKQQDAANQMSEQMQKMVMAFNQSSEAAMSNMLKASNAAQQGLNASVEQTKASAQSMVDSMQEISNKQAAMLEEAVISNKKRVDDTVDLLQETIKKNNETVGKAYVAVKDMAATLEGLLEKMNKSGAAMEQSVAPVLEATQALKLQLENVQTQTNRLHEKTVHQIDRLTGQNELTSKSIHNLAEAVKEAENKAVEAWNTYNNGLNGIEKEISGVLDNITDNITQYNQVTHKGMKDELSIFDNSMSSATNQLKSVIEELSELVEDLMDYNKSRK